MAGSPLMRISRCTRFRLTHLPSRANQTFMRLDP